MDAQTGALTFVYKHAVSGGPASIAVDSGNKHLYVAQRNGKTISPYTADPSSGRLTANTIITAVDDPVYVHPDRSAHFLLSAYYSAHNAAIYAITSNGTLNPKPVQIVSTGTNPHAIGVDPGNRYLYIPCKSSDYVLHYRFNAQSGSIFPNSPASVISPASTGPRHLQFHGMKNCVYNVHELASSVTGYTFDTTTGTLTAFQTFSTVPPDDTTSNLSADIHITPDNTFLYTSNRGHESIAAFRVDPTSGKLTAVGYYPTEQTCREFDRIASIFVSQDCVALESVNFDVMRAESKFAGTNAGTVDNHLHETALANNPPPKQCMVLKEAVPV
jgi:6-phosphogluconolactonase